jgi:streptomycin 6-kinase
MYKLTQNVTNILGENGKTWIANLPNTVAILMKYWNLSNLLPVNNMTFNYVAKAISNGAQPVVLKIGFDAKVIADEMKALTYFDGHASILLLDYNEKYNALLLQQAIPGTSLKSLYPANENFVIDCYVYTVQRLLDKPLPGKCSFRHISDWLGAIDRIKPEQLPEYLLEKAIYLKNILLASMRTEIVLHGDLHHDNILKDGDTWLTIDPKGIIGEPEFEIAAFDFIHNTEFTGDIDIKKLFLTRIKLVAERTGLSAERIQSWVFVRLILSAAWYIEDNGDPSWAIKLAEMLAAF